MNICKVPVALFIFNRPELTARVFAEIRCVRPSKLLIVADGPRFEDERKKVGAARSVVDHGVDWDCEVLRNYADENMGCKYRVSSGLDWVFEQVEEAIILEDDCLPHPTFFPFCQELLNKYRDDERIAMVSGSNPLKGRLNYRYSYYFSTTYPIWGWATWRRAWLNYDVEMTDWPIMRETSFLEDFSRNKEIARNTRKIFDNVYYKQTDTWDIQWGYACVKMRALGIVPRNNLISNIGFGKEGTHTTQGKNNSRLLTRPMEFPLEHPPVVERSEEYDLAMWMQIQSQSRKGVLRRVRTLTMQLRKAIQSIML